MESIELPRALPLLPLHGQVLLPTAFVRVQVSRKALRRYVCVVKVLHANQSGSLQSWADLGQLKLLCAAVWRCWSTCQHSQHGSYWWQ
jgi:hypothetical protein